MTRQENIADEEDEVRSQTSTLRFDHVLTTDINPNAGLKQSKSDTDIGIKTSYPTTPQAMSVFHAVPGKSSTFHAYLSSYLLQSEELIIPLTRTKKSTNLTFTILFKN